MAQYVGTNGNDASYVVIDAAVGAGVDDLQGFNGNDILQGYGGTDFITGGTGDDQLWGDTKRSDLLSADDGTDFLWGEAGNDVLHGNAGDDSLIGGAGNDELFGNGGNATAVFSADFGFYAVVRRPVVVGGGRQGYDLEIVSWGPGRPDGTDFVHTDVEFFQFGGLHGVVLTRDQVLARSDDYGGDIWTQGQVLVGGSVDGALETVVDGDMFRVQLNADAIYQIDLLGADTGNGTLADPYVSLWDSAGGFITENDDAGVGR